MRTLNSARIFAALALACIALLLSACGQVTGEGKETGPNANLSNNELLKKAVANMAAVSGYHLEIQNQPFEGQSEKTTIPDAEVERPFNMVFSMTVSIQPEAKGSTLKWRSVDGVGFDSIISKEHTYNSSDGGKTWSLAIGDNGPGFLMKAMLDFWYTNEIESDLKNGLVLDGDSKSDELLDGSLVRRMTADIGTMKDGFRSFLRYAGDGANLVTFWVSTDDLPVVHQMRMERKSSGGGFRAIWKWSRFNEDFGEVKPPPTETIKSP